MRKPKSLLKAQFLEYWGKMKRRRQIKPRPVPYKHRGSTYDQDGIRITGSRQFVDSVLSRLTDLLEFENEIVRLQVVYKQIVDRESGQPIDAWSCYIQVHDRGDEAKMTNLFVAAMSGREKVAG